jgi:hypothetical protein
MGTVCHGYFRLQQHHGRACQNLALQNSWTLQGFQLPVDGVYDIFRNKYGFSEDVRPQESIRKNCRRNLKIQKGDMDRLVAGYVEKFDSGEFLIYKFAIKSMHFQCKTLVFINLLLPLRKKGKWKTDTVPTAYIVYKYTLYG